MIQEFAFANIGRNYKSKSQVVDNMRLCKQAAPDASWGFVEIDGDDAADEHGILQMLFPASEGWRWSGRARQQVALARQIREGLGTARRRALPRMARKGCDGIEKWSAARYIAEVIIADEDFETPIVHIVTHFPRPSGGTKPAPKTARREWNKLYKALQTRADYWHERGYTSIISIDANDEHFDVKGLHPQARQLVGRYVDYIITVPAKGVRVRKLAYRNVNLNIDGHNGHIVRLSVK